MPRRKRKRNRKQSAHQEATQWVRLANEARGKPDEKARIEKLLRRMERSFEREEYETRPGRRRC